jgi:phytoene dehydrogenase-like protein
MSTHYDYVIIGAGMGGLTVGALLAHAGAKVALVEAHEYPGGCCHTFPMGDDYKFCAAVHYIFSCGEGQPVYNLLRTLGLHEKITFERLDPEGYDHFSCPSAALRFRIPNGLAKWGARMCDRFPADTERIRSFFRVVTLLAAQVDELPERYTARSVLRAIVASPAVVQVARYRSHTLQRLMDEHHLSPAVQAIVATQMGDLGLPPRDVSLLIWIALVARYGDGAYYPTEHFSSLIDGITNAIAQSAGCSVSFNTEIASVRCSSSGRVEAVVSTDGRAFSGARFICNADPKWFVGAMGRENSRATGSSASITNTRRRHSRSTSACAAISICARTASATGTCGTTRRWTSTPPTIDSTNATISAIPGCSFPRPRCARRAPRRDTRPRATTSWRSSPPVATCRSRSAKRAACATTPIARTPFAIA